MEGGDKPHAYGSAPTGRTVGTESRVRYFVGAYELISPVGLRQPYLVLAGAAVSGLLTNYFVNALMPA